MCIKGAVMYSVTGLIKDIGMLLNPVEQSFCVFFSASSLFFCASMYYFVGKFSGSNFIKVLISENLVGDFLEAFLVVLSKYLLIWLTFPLMVNVLGFYI